MSLDLELELLREDVHAFAGLAGQRMDNRARHKPGDLHRHGAFGLFGLVSGVGGLQDLADFHAQRVDQLRWRTRGFDMGQRKGWQQGT